MKRLLLSLLTAAVVLTPLHAGEKKVRNHSDDAFILIDGKQTYCHGDSDIASIKRLRQTSDSRLAWVRRKGGEYLIRDRALLDEMAQIVEPERLLGEQQAKLGAQQAHLGTEQAALGAKQAQLGARSAALALAEVSRSSSESSDETERLAIEVSQGQLSRDQDALGWKQDALGAKQEKLSQQMSKLSIETEAKLGALVDRAIADGRAQQSN